MKLAVACVLLALGCQAASAQTPMNMLGTWKGQATAAHLGVNPYRPTEGNTPNLPAAVLEFTFTIKEQQGNRFSGSATAGTRTETIIGAISPDNESGVMLDDDGQYMLTVRDPDTVNVCYFHSVQAGKVVACYTLKRAS